MLKRNNLFKRKTFYFVPFVERRSFMNWHIRKFHLISPFYQLFFKFQTLYYSKLINAHFNTLTTGGYLRILDLGTGTGAFGWSFQKAGHHVMAADAAPGMVKLCRKNGLDCVEFDILEGIPFKDNSFAVVTGAYIAHGMSRPEREILYKEASRVADKYVLFHDFSNRYNFVISVIERVEGSHYREFIRSVPREMEKYFQKLDVVPVDPWHNWYIGQP